jgi:hypothetical protein
MKRKFRYNFSRHKIGVLLSQTRFLPHLSLLEIQMSIKGTQSDVRMPEWNL